MPPAVPRLSTAALQFVRSARIAHLATVSREGEPSVVPICFVFDGRYLFTPIDEKPKNTAPENLRRVRNIRSHPRVSVVIDRYREDWRRLGFVLLRGRARVVLSGRHHRRATALLREKYPQYRAMALEDRPMIMIAPARAVTWGRLDR